jgi:hypothetical protein
MDAADLLKRALSSISEAKIPDDLRVVAFAKAFDVLAADQAPMPHPTLPSASGTAGPLPAAIRSGSSLGRIAQRLERTEAAIEALFHIEGDDLEVIVNPNKLDSQKSKGTEQLAQLVAAGRQATGLDEDGWTNVDVIRGICEHFGRLDAGNFAATIKNMRDVFLVRGEGRGRKVKLTAPGWQKVAVLIDELAGQ